MRNTGTLRGGRYLVQNPMLLAWLRISDGLLDAKPARARVPPHPSQVREVLLAVGGHLGDAIIATAMLARVQRAFPTARIGVVTAAWNRQIFEGHPRVARLHFRNHWRHERRPLSWMARVQGSYSSARQASGEIAAVGYDVAIDLSPYWPNAALLLWRARVPVRVGFTSGGRGALFTHPVDWVPGRHASEDHLHLLRQLVSSTSAGAARYELPPAPSPAEPVHGCYALREPYAVIHMGAGHRLKEWPTASWIEVARALDAAGVHVALTGVGAHQASMALALADQVAAVNLCDALDWNGFRAVLHGARLVLTVDTVAGHLAAAVRTPCVVVMAVLDDARRWRPLGDKVTVVPYRVYSEDPEPPVAPAAVIQAASAYLPALSATRRS